MAQIKAFVARSFREQDEDHVRKFLGLLDHVSDTNPDFIWEDAIAAKPIDLRQKVFEKIEGKNLLIAICSRHSYVVDPGSLKRVFGRACLTFPSNLIWTTSDWIVQEIGLALGRGMKLILLLEAGVKAPGGLQGNIEYIPFSRDYPERSFVSVMEMISSLVTRASTTGRNVTTSETPPTTGSVAQDMPQQSQAPTPDMSREDLEHGWFLALINRDDVLQQDYRTAFLASECGASEIERARWDVREQWLKQLTGVACNIGFVRNVRQRWPTDAQIALYEARLLEFMEEFSLAASSYHVAAENSSDLAKKIEFFCSAAGAYERGGEINLSDASLSDARNVVAESGVDEALILEFLRSSSALFESRSKLMKIASLEAILGNDPGDNDKRFTLAFAYGDIDKSDMAFYHYSRISVDVRNPWAWNNLGVAAGNLKMKGLAVEAYEQAVAKGNTLAVSNLSGIRRDAGFLKEAEDACRAALMREDCDTQVATTLSSIVSQSKEETQSSAGVRERGEKLSKFMRHLGRGIAESGSQELSGKWTSSKCELILTENNGEILLTGTFDRPVGLHRLSIGTDAAPTEKMSVSFSGIRYGNSIIGKVVVSPDRAELISSLLGSERESEFCMYLVEDRNQLVVVEFKSVFMSDGFYELTRS